MLSLKFPPLHKLLGKNLKELADDDPKRGVVVMNDHAVVTDDRFILCFNLRDYFVVNQGVDNEDDIVNLNEIFDFINNKMFLGPFWEELTKSAYVSIEDGDLHLEGIVNKALFHEAILFKPTTIIDGISGNINHPALELSKTGFYISTIEKIISKLKPLVGSDSMVLEFIGSSSTIRFTCKDNPWIFGVMSCDGEASNSQFMFENMGNFSRSIKQ